MNAREITERLGGDWHGSRGLCPCIRCQPQGRKDQRALSVRQGDAGGILLHCFKCKAPFKDLAGALDIPKAQRARPDEIKRAAAKDERERKNRAAKLWLDPLCRPIKGTYAGLYLRKRGITLEIPDTTARFHPRAFHMTRTHLPRLLWRATDATGAGTGVQRVYLTPDGDKTSRNPQKAHLGSFAGSAVRFGDPRATECVVGEGCETTLAAMQLAGVPAGFAALSTSGMTAWEPSKHIQTVTLLADLDESRAGEIACRKTAERLKGLGLSVTIVQPKAGGDFCDELMGVGDE